MMATRIEIEADLDRLAHLNRCIEILAARNPQGKSLGDLADELESYNLDLLALDKARSLREQARDIDLLQAQARKLESDIRAEVLVLQESVQGQDLEAIYKPARAIIRQGDRNG